MWTHLAQLNRRQAAKRKETKGTFTLDSSLIWFFVFVFTRRTSNPGVLFTRKEADARSAPFSILPVSLQLIHERPEDHCWFFLGLVLFQHSARQLTGQLFRFGSLACELSYGDYTWQAVRNWTGSSGKQGSATHLPFSAHSKHAHNTKKRDRKYREFPVFHFTSSHSCFSCSKCLFPNNSESYVWVQIQ